MSSPAGLKDGAGTQSRFKWMMDGNSLTPSPPEQTLHNGKILRAHMYFSKSADPLKVLNSLM